MKWAQKQTGFTIVELLIVIVVVAILAAIVIVAYNGVRDRAQSSAAASELASIAKKIETVKATNSDRYPADLATAGLPIQAGVEFTYVTNADQSAYCASSKRDGLLYSVANGQTNAVPGGCAGVLPGALGWWRFNGNGTDSSGYARDLPVISGMSSAVGQGGQAATALAFNGLAQPELPAINLANTSFSISGWMYVNAFNSSGSYNQAPMLGARNIAASYAAMHFGLRAINTSTNPRVYMDYYAFGQAGNTLVGTGTWLHVGYVYNQSTNVRHMYLNGALDATHGSGVLYQGVVDSIGYSCCMTGGIQGRLDDIRIYGRALSQAEMASIYAQSAQ